MKEDTKFGTEGVGSFSCHVGGGLQWSERASWNDLGKPLLRTITQTSSARQIVTLSGDEDRRPRASDDLESTRTLLELTRDGDDGARERLIRRFLPALQCWARGRVPRKLKDLANTDDVVQMTFLRALERLDRIEYLHEGGFFAYLRTVLRNQIVDLLRRNKRRPEDDSIPENFEDPGPSPFDQAVGAEILGAYEAALETLTEQQRAAVTLRIELGMSFKEVADSVGCPSANAARMLVARAVVRLSEVMDDPR